MSDSNNWEQLAIGLADMARDLLAQDSVQQTLDRIVTHAVQLVDGCEAAGILLMRDHQVTTLAATDNVVRAADRLQGELREGPCFDAARYKEEIYRIGDLTSNDQGWRRFAPEARKLGIGSMMGFLLFTEGEQNLGSLDLYSSRAGAFSERSEHAGWVLASHAAVALAGARHDAQLHKAISTRQDIGEALGIIMERHKVDEHTAFDLLTRISQNSNTKIRELAHTINTTGEIPPGD